MLLFFCCTLTLLLPFFKCNAIFLTLFFKRSALLLVTFLLNFFLIYLDNDLSTWSLFVNAYHYFLVFSKCRFIQCTSCIFVTKLKTNERFIENCQLVVCTNLTFGHWEGSFDTGGLVITKEL